jgi:translation initiation factor IF-2
LEDLFSRIEGGEEKTLNLVIRADMQGTLEPVVQSVKGLSNDEVSIEILHSAIGDISESDVMLAEASDAIIIGFSVDVDKAAQVRAEASGVEIRLYDVIYKLVEDIEDALVGLLEPVYEDFTIGHAQVLRIFKLRRGTIAGCQISDGVARRNALARVFRDDEIVIPETRIESLHRFDEDVVEVRTGFECGIKLAGGSSDVAEGDLIEVYESRRTR